MTEMLKDCEYGLDDTELETKQIAGGKTMSDEIKIKGTESSGRRTKDAKSVFGLTGRATVIGVALVAGVGVWIYSALAEPPPVLTIAPLGSNQFSITITNGVTNANYGLYWTPVLNDSNNYPWMLLDIGAPGETNWMVDGGVWPVSFFRVITGTDWDGDGIPNWQDGNPLDPNVGILTLVIDAPANGSTID